jgi:polyisoprenoid-binding protein YceI
VRSARFLDASRYPVISFRGGQVGADDRTIRGTLTVGEVSRPVILSLGQVTVTDRSFTASASLRVDRTEFDLTAMRGLAGRYLDLTAEVRFAPRTPHA